MSFSIWTTALTLWEWGFCISLRAKQLGLHFWCAIIIIVWHCSDDNVHWSFIMQPLTPWIKYKSTPFYFTCSKALYFQINNLNSQFNLQLSEYFWTNFHLLSYHRPLNPYGKCFGNKANLMAEEEQGEVLVLLIMNYI